MAPALSHMNYIIWIMIGRHKENGAMTQPENITHNKMSTIDHDRLLGLHARVLLAHTHTYLIQMNLDSLRFVQGKNSDRELLLIIRLSFSAVVD